MCSRELACRWFSLQKSKQECNKRSTLSLNPREGITQYQNFSTSPLLVPQRVTFPTDRIRINTHKSGRSNKTPVIGQITIILKLNVVSVDFSVRLTYFMMHKGLLTDTLVDIYCFIWDSSNTFVPCGTSINAIAPEVCCVLNELSEGFVIELRQTLPLMKPEIELSLLDHWEALSVVNRRCAERISIQISLHSVLGSWFFTSANRLILTP